MNNLMNKCTLTNTHVICNGIDVNGISFEMTKQEVDQPIIQLKQQIRDKYNQFYDYNIPTQQLTLLSNFGHCFDPKNYLTYTKENMFTLCQQQLELILEPLCRKCEKEDGTSIPPVVDYTVMKQEFKHCQKFVLYEKRNINLRRETDRLEHI